MNWIQGLCRVSLDMQSWEGKAMQEEEANECLETRKTRGQE